MIHWQSIWRLLECWKEYIVLSSTWGLVAILPFVLLKLLTRFTETIYIYISTLIHVMGIAIFVLSDMHMSSSNEIHLWMKGALCEETDVAIDVEKEDY